jgi:xanthine dehydrogenase accessory factor
MKEIFEILKARAAASHVPYALATVVRVEGSSYRRPGARMLIGMNGRVAGSVSGGCLEKDVISKGLEVMITGLPQVASYDTTDEDDLAFGTSLGCQGRIELWIERILPGNAWPLEDFVNRILHERKPCALATIYRGHGDGAKLTGHCHDSVDAALSGVLDPEQAADLTTQMEVILGTKKARSVAYESPRGGIELLLERIAPPISLLLFGGGHDVPPLVRLAKEMGHHVTVIDRRAEFADPHRFPGADAVLLAKPSQVLERISCHDLCAVVLMNHHYETDRDLLGIFHATPLAYLGMLGPRKRTIKIVDELAQGGVVFPPGALEKLHAPAGLDIGSENPEEIALSILAEMQAILGSGRAVHLRDRFSPIHAPDHEAQESPVKPCPALASSF